MTTTYDEFLARKHRAAAQDGLIYDLAREVVRLREATARRTVRTAAERERLASGTVLVDERDGSAYLVNGYAWDHVADHLDRDLLVVWEPKAGSR
ncbi:hypothetical protein [Gordonia sp. (in: high G+C Gram-positive bacteria)]|uniref:hypothetical protein n=1 Tax=Gordonia sp. (in: high G+C Gram-positive bacteria) TaxID=84139 RepID=UPI0039E5D9D1